MGYIVPTWEIAAEAKRHFVNQSIDYAFQKAMVAGLARTLDELHAQDLHASDLGLTSWQIPEQPAYTTITWISHRIEGKVIVLLKVVQLSEKPTISEIKVSSPATDIYELGHLYGLIPLLRKIKQLGDLEILQTQYGLENLRMEGWFSSPHIFGPGDCAIISVTSNSPKASSGDKLVLVGYVVEKHEYS